MRGKHVHAVRSGRAEVRPGASAGRHTRPGPQGVPIKAKPAMTAAGAIAAESGEAGDL